MVHKGFDSEESVIDWMIDNQLGRRNLTPDQFKLLLGRKYNRVKGKQGGDKKSKYQNDTLIDTAESLAQEHGVSAPTVKRAGSAAEAIDTQGAPELVKPYWADKIQNEYNKTVESIFQIGRDLIQAKETLDHGEWWRLTGEREGYDSMLPFSARTAQRYIAIAADKRLDNPTHASGYPASWGYSLRTHHPRRQTIQRMLGRKYNRVKKQGKRSDLTSDQIDQKLATDERLAQEHGVSAPTVRRAGSAAEAIDNKATFELVEQVEQGNISVNVAAEHEVRLNVFIFVKKL